MTDPATLLEQCRVLGATFIAEGKRLRVQAPEPLPDDLITALRELKAEVLAELGRERRDGLHRGIQEEWRRVRAWAGNEPERWKRVHSALLRIYAPAWEHVDARDILVAWAAACLALTRAKRQLTRLESLQRPLGRRELDAKRARQADISFWGRLAHWLAAQVPTALAEDAEAAKVLAVVVNGERGKRG